MPAPEHCAFKATHGGCHYPACQDRALKLREFKRVFKECEQTAPSHDEFLENIFGAAIEIEKRCQ